MKTTMELVDAYVVKMMAVANYVKNDDPHKARAALAQRIEALEKDAAKLVQVVMVLDGYWTRLPQGMANDLNEAMKGETP
jgi:hypothetical protein